MRKEEKEEREENERRGKEYEKEYERECEKEYEKEYEKKYEREYEKALQIVNQEETTSSKTVQSANQVWMRVRPWTKTKLSLTSLMETVKIPFVYFQDCLPFPL